MNPPPRLSRTAWLICFIAAVGFLFDIYELLMLPLILKPALASLGGLSPDGPGSTEYTTWARMLFFVPAIFGGIFGLLGGYLTDRLGRRRVLTFSILLYAVSAFAAGYSTNLWQLLVLRCCVFVGVCVEFVAAVAWLAELFPDPKQREKVLGYTQAFSSIGGFLVAAANKGAVAWAESLPAIHGGHEAWRYTLISGIIPAIPLILIRPFLPESPVWAEKKAAGQLKRASLLAIFTPELRRTTLVSAVVMASCFGLAFGAIQHLPQIVPGLADVKAEVKEATVGKPAPSAKGIGKKIEGQRAAEVQLWQETGGLLGRVALALLAVHILSRRTLFRIFHLPALVFIPLFFWWISGALGTPGTLEWVKWGAAASGFLVVATFSFWGNYLPLVYPVHLRGTGESFAANIGGRILGTSAAWFTLTFTTADRPMALTAAVVAGIFALVGAVLTPWLTEPKAETLAE